MAKQTDEQKTTAELPKNSQGPQPLSEIVPNVLSRFATVTPPTPEQIATRQARQKYEEEERAKMRADYAKKSLAKTMGARYAECRLENFTIRYVEQKAALAMVKAFLANVADDVKIGRGLILYGTVGTGKDHLLAASLFAAIDAGFGASWQNAQSIFEAARDQMDAKGSESDLMKQFTEPTILGLSDPTPPAGDLTGYRVELLWRIADVRYRNLKPIWLTMNANSIEECKKKLSIPLWDRLQDNALCVPCFWPSYRVKP